jgi:hypothetical protein
LFHICVNFNGGLKNMSLVHLRSALLLVLCWQNKNQFSNPMRKNVTSSQMALNSY